MAEKARPQQYEGVGHIASIVRKQTGQKVALVYKTLFFSHDSLLLRLYLLKVPQVPQTARAEN